MSMKLKILVFILASFSLLGLVTFMAVAHSGDPLSSGNQPLQVPVLTYHDVIPDNKKMMANKYDVTVSELRENFTYLKNHGYTTVTLEQLYDFMTRDKPLPAKPIVITFDDGYKSFYKYVFPMLKKMDMKASLAIITGPVKENGAYYFVSWSEVKEMTASGLVEVVSHTRTHPMLGLLREKKKLASELADSDRAIASHLGRPSHIIVYPFGSYNWGVIKMAKAEYKMGISTDPGIDRYGDPIWKVKRISVHYGATGSMIDEEIKAFEPQRPSRFKRYLEKLLGFKKYEYRLVQKL